MARVDSSVAPHHAVRIGRITDRERIASTSRLFPRLAMCLEIRLRLPQVNSGLTL
jgi:hypothetical protein